MVSLVVCLHKVLICIEKKKSNKDVSLRVDHFDVSPGTPLLKKKNKTKKTINQGRIGCGR